MHLPFLQAPTLQKKTELASNEIIQTIQDNLLSELYNKNCTA